MLHFPSFDRTLKVRLLMKITVAIQIDALRHDYITDNESLFVSSLKNGGISGSLIPTFGFEPDAAYFAGLYPEECDGGAHYWFDPENSPFRFTKFCSGWLEHLPELPELAARRMIRWVAQSNSKHSAIRCHAPTGRIPLRFLHHFDFPVKRLPFEVGFISEKKTVFDMLRENKKPWFFQSNPLHRVNSELVLRRVRNELRSTCAFAFLHIGDLDSVSHKYGPSSIERKEALRQVDAHIEEIYEIMRERFEDVHLLIFGDHGMVEVNHTVNIESVLKNLELKPGKDYAFFLDSTMARFWFLNQEARIQITSILQELKDGKILSEEDRVRYRINYPHSKFGDIIFLVSPGRLIYPNFFQNRRPVKGMHGYAPETPEQHSVFLIHSSRVTVPKFIGEPVDMRRLFPTLLDLLELDIPSTCDPLQSLL